MLAAILKSIFKFSNQFHTGVQRIVFAAIYFGQLKKTAQSPFPTPISPHHEPDKLTVIFVGDNMPLLTPEECNVIHIDPLSAGMSLDDYKNLINTTINDLQTKGVANSHIVLIGKGLDGAICLEVATGHNGIRVIADQVFARLDDTAGLAIKNLVPTWILRLTLGNVLYYTTKGLIHQLGLGVDASAAYANIIKNTPQAAKILRTYDDPHWQDSSDSLIAYNIQRHLRSFKDEPQARTINTRKTHHV